MAVIDEKLRDSYSRDYWCALIMQWVHSERDRAIIKRRILDGIALEPLAEEFELSVAQIKRIVHRAEKQLADKVK